MPSAFQSLASIERKCVCVSEWPCGGDTLAFGSQDLCVTGQERAGDTFSDPPCHGLLQKGWAIKPSEKCPVDILFSSAKMFQMSLLAADYIKVTTQLPV